MDHFVVDFWNWTIKMKGNATCIDTVKSAENKTRTTLAHVLMKPNMKNHGSTPDFKRKSKGEKCMRRGKQSFVRKNCMYKKLLHRWMVFAVRHRSGQKIERAHTHTQTHTRFCVCFIFVFLLCVAPHHRTTCFDKTMYETWVKLAHQNQVNELFLSILLLLKMHNVQLETEPPWCSYYTDGCQRMNVPQSGQPDTRTRKHCSNTDWTMARTWHKTQYTIQ